MDLGETLDEIDAIYAQRTAFGTNPMAPTAPLGPFSQAAMQAAENLLVKALDRMGSGEQDAAERLMGRAAEIPFDDHEGVWPGPEVAADLLYNLIADHSELLAEFEFDDEGNEPPIEVHLGIREIKGRLSPGEGEALREVMREILTVAGEYGIDRHQVGRLREVLELLPRGEYHRELPGDATTQQRLDSIAAACRVSALLLETFYGEY
ncbi:MULTISPECIES: hypothetical protein [Dietzia]|nr:MULTISPECIES: hypothetical protein [Dietzia]MBB1040612.1 hypothetical protein [Dietzia sp. Cai40]MBB1046744.1 hypothetical protein [Dietzia cercidiphylli]MBB1053072.1 hypothetical protein [Dietzia sp. B44]